MLAGRQHIFLRHIRERREMVIFNRVFFFFFFIQPNLTGISWMKEKALL